VELRLAPLASLAGKVTLADAGAPTRFILTARGPDFLVQTYEHTDGAWSIEGLAAGEYGVVVEADEGMASTKVTLAAGEDKTGVDLEMARPGEVRGTIVDADTHEPVVGARVIAADATGTTRRRATDALDTRNITDATGAFRVQAGPGAVAIEVAPPPGPKSYLKLTVAVMVDPGATVDLGAIELPAPCLSAGEEPGRYGFSWALRKGGVDAEHGVTVIEVEPGSPLAKAGLKVGDEIVEIEGVSVVGAAWPNAHGLGRCRVGHTSEFSLADSRTLQATAVARP
jgi:hypothetical protein